MTPTDNKPASKDPDPDPVATKAAADAAKRYQEASAKVTTLEKDLTAAKEALAALPPVPVAPPEPFLSDEGVSVARLDGDHLVNLTDPAIDPDQARRLEVHVGGRAYAHVGTDAQGRWTYRHDH